MSKKVAGVVLAAGLSSRMGRSKALLKVGDSVFLDSMAEALRLGGCDPVMAVVSGDLSPIRQACRLEGVRLVFNPHPEGGQISSLRCALRACPDVGGWLVVLVDQGKLIPESVSVVRQALDERAVAVARYQGQFGHPTAFGLELAESLLGPEADQGARRVVESQERKGQVGYVDVDDPGVIRNLNRPADYQAFLEDLSDSGK